MAALSALLAPEEPSTFQSVVYENVCRSCNKGADWKKELDVSTDIPFGWFKKINKMWNLN